MALIRCSTSSGGGGLSETTLWQNQNPTSDFGSGSSATTITLSESIQNFTYIGVYFKQYKTYTITSNPERFATVYISVEDFEKCLSSTTSPQFVISGMAQVSYLATWVRSIWKKTDTTIDIGGAVQKNGTSVENAVAIPLKIIGLK